MQATNKGKGSNDRCVLLGVTTYLTLLSNGFVGGSISEIFLAHFSYALVDFSSPGIERTWRMVLERYFNQQVQQTTKHASTGQLTGIIFSTKQSEIDQ